MTNIIPGPSEQAGLAGLISETDWQSLAPAAGGVGRFVYDPQSGLCQIDVTLRRITGMLDMVSSMPADAFMDRISPEDRPRISDALRQAAVSGQPYDEAFRFLRDDGTELWLSGQGRMMTSSQGHDLLVGVTIDVTETRRAQERAELVSREMAHRMKNVFALVQGMFNMAARSAETKDALVLGFTGRLHALAAVNALTFAGDDRSVEMTDLIDAVLGPHVAGGRVRLDVANFKLNGAAAQTLVLVLNELLTNAVKYGALHGDEGTVAVTVETDEIDGGGFTLGWAETANRPISAPTGPGGFGMRVLNSMTAATFRGRPKLEWAETGLRFSCRWPRDDMASANEGSHEHGPL